MCCIVSIFIVIDVKTQYFGLSEDYMIVLHLNFELSKSPSKLKEFVTIELAVLTLFKTKIKTLFYTSSIHICILNILNRKLNRSEAVLRV